MSEKIQHPSDMSKMIRVVRVRLWLAIGILCSLLFAFGVWVCFGSIPRDVRGKGVMIGSLGMIANRAVSDGVVKKIKVHPGQFVEEGQALVDLESVQSAEYLQAAKRRRDELEAECEQLCFDIAEEEKNNENTFKEQMLLKKEIFQQKELILSEIKTKKDLYQKGVLTRLAVGSAERNLQKKEQDLAKIDLICKELQSSEKKKDFLVKQVALQEATDFCKSIQEKKSRFQVCAESSGTILQVMHALGDPVGAGDSIVWMEKTAHQQGINLFLACFPAEEGGRIKVGQPVQVDISTVNKGEYGVLQGRVIEVSRIPAIMEHVANRIQNKTIAKMLTSGAEQWTQVVIEPEMNESTISGYRWTTPSGPPYEITAGVLGDVRVVVERRSPLSYLVPLR